MAQDPYYEPPKKNNTVRIVIIVLIALVVCCCITLVAAWFLGDPVLEFLRDQGIDLGLYLPSPW